MINIIYTYLRFFKQSLSLSFPHSSSSRSTIELSGLSIDFFSLLWSVFFHLWSVRILKTITVNHIEFRSELITVIFWILTLHYFQKYCISKLGWKPFIWFINSLIGNVPGLGSVGRLDAYFILKRDWGTSPSSSSLPSRLKNTPWPEFHPENNQQPGFSSK